MPFVDVRGVVDVACAAVALGSIWACVAAQHRIRRHRATIADLRRAFANEVVPIPGLAIGSALVAGASDAGVGGDVVDVFALDARFTLLLVADVCGRGVEAAAHTAFIKYTLRALALESDGPAVVLAKFNAMYGRTVRDGESFATLIIGIVDAHTGDVRYASAGHEPAFVRRRGGSVTVLPPTGPIVGVTEFSGFASGVVTLGRGDLLVWTSDGMTESRDQRRRLLGIEGLAHWIASAPHTVDAAAAWLIESLRRRSGATGDDVAILTVAYDAAAVQRPAAVLRRPHKVAARFERPARGEQSA